MDMPMDYYEWGAMVEHYQRHMLKLSSIMPSWKTVLSMIDDLLNKFNDNATV